MLRYDYEFTIAMKHPIPGFGGFGGHWHRDHDQGHRAGNSKEHGLHQLRARIRNVVVVVVRLDALGGLGDISNAPCHERRNERFNG